MGFSRSHVVADTHIFNIRPTHSSGRGSCPQKPATETFGGTVGLHLLPLCTAMVGRLVGIACISQLAGGTSSTAG